MDSTASTCASGAPGKPEERAQGAMGASILGPGDKPLGQEIRDPKSIGGLGPSPSETNETKSHGSSEDRRSLCLSASIGEPLRERRWAEVRSPLPYIQGLAVPQPPQ